MRAVRGSILTLVVALATLSGLCARTWACSCFASNPPQFLLPDTVAVPPNIGGIPLYYPGPIEGLKDRYVKLERYRRGARVIVPREIVEVQEERFFGQLQTIVLIRPKGGFEPGSRYRVTYRSPRAKGFMEVHVLDRPLTLSDAAVVLVPERMSVGNLQIAAGGSCSLNVRAAQIPLTARFESTEPKVTGAILYFWEIEGVGPYWPRHHVCERVRPGRSWTGRNTNLIYSLCNSKDNGKGYALAPGTHEVRVTAWLPGTTETWESTEIVEIECGDEESEPEPGKE